MDLLTLETSLLNAADITVFARLVVVQGLTESTRYQTAPCCSSLWAAISVQYVHVSLQANKVYQIYVSSARPTRVKGTQTCIAAAQCKDSPREKEHGIPCVKDDLGLDSCQLPQDVQQHA